MAKFGDKLSKFANNTKKQTHIMLKTNKLNSAVGKEKSGIQTTYSTIGKLYFDTYADDTEIPEQFADLNTKIKNHQLEIETLELRHLEVKGVKICPGCDREIPLESVFCNKCGHKFDEVTEVEAEEVENPCPHCGEPLEIGSTFCGKCGQKVE